ncbi:hypothetical protein NPIL_228931 [Nephila pilipes]|uniref:Uncharacterized protein n=1 Tax=Nephila pilipes TaxID=299642 RepID=A0A8X6P3B6_NEPPI|nr:hypothetical protein NPIL_228931 [Nephila pilipes]
MPNRKEDNGNDIADEERLHVAEDMSGLCFERARPIPEHSCPQVLLHSMDESTILFKQEWTLSELLLP